MNEELDKLMVWIIDYLKRSPTDLKDVVLAATYGVQKSIDEISEKIAQRDKALMMIHRGTDYDSPKNIDDMVDVMTDNLFNGDGHQFTREEVAHLVRRSYKRRKESRSNRKKQIV